MTIRVRIENVDVGPSRKVTVQAEDEHTLTSTTTILPGDSQEFWIHSGRKLHVTEGDVILPEDRPTDPNPTSAR